MERYAVIENGEVLNIILLNNIEDWVPPVGCIVIQTDVAAIGWLYIDELFSEPEQVEPENPDLEALAVLARIERDRQLVEIYDKGISMAMRAARLATTQEQKDYAASKIIELDQYSILLLNIPEQAGFPLTIVWPTQPTE